MSKRNLFLLLTVNCALLTFLISCTTIYNPATGKKETFLINTPTEVNIGKNVAEEVLKEYKVLEDSKVQGKIQNIGQRVSRASDRQDIKYNFTVLESEELNAFAIPGGGIYITTGLADILDQDELASVLAHEIGHIAARHSVKRIQGQLGYQLLMTAAIYGVSRKDEALARRVSQGANSVFQLILLGYSRNDELLADKLAIKYADKSGYNPRGMVSALEKLEEHSKEGNSPKAMVIFRSHPYLADRIKQAQIEIASLIKEDGK